MDETDLKIQKAKLIERMGVQFEKEYQLAPVAARIFTTLIITGKEGITFDQLVTDLNAGKSTVSTHLEHLQATNRIEYFTKPGDRKRYFIIKPDLMENYLDELTNKWEAQKCIHKEILEYKIKSNKLNKEGSLYDIEFHENLLDFLNEASAAVNKLKKNIAKKNTPNY